MKIEPNIKSKALVVREKQHWPIQPVSCNLNMDLRTSDRIDPFPIGIRVNDPWPSWRVSIISSRITIIGRPDVFGREAPVFGETLTYNRIRTAVLFRARHFAGVEAKCLERARGNVTVGVGGTLANRNG